MTTAWIVLMIAGLFEVGWAIGLKYSDGFNFVTKPLASMLTLAGLAASMYLLAVATRTIPIGTAYAIWTGVGAVGAATLGMVLFHEPATFARIGCLMLVVLGMIGLKLTSPSAHGAAAPLETPSTSHSEDAMTFYIGTYTGGKSAGIYRATLDLKTGKIDEPTVAATITNPSFIAMHPTRPLLYAANEVGDFKGERSGSVTAFAIDDATNTLRLLNQQPSAGQATCFVSTDPAGRVVLAANYASGTVASLPIAPDGSLHSPFSIDQHVGSGPNPKRQDKAYAHSITPDPTGRYALACDLGTDQVLVYKLDANSGSLSGRQSFNIAPAGSGPRHLAFHPNGKIVYLINEMGASITVLAWDGAAGTLAQVQTVPTLPDRFTDANTCAEVRVHPGGKFVYGSNRGHDSIAIFSADATSGRLTPVGHVFSRGKEPRGFEIDPTGRYLLAANQKSDNIVSFEIDPRTGGLTPTGYKIEVGSPVCIRFDPRATTR